MDLNIMIIIIEFGIDFNDKFLNEFKTKLDIDYINQI